MIQQKVAVILCPYSCYYGFQPGADVGHRSYDNHLTPQSQTDGVGATSPFTVAATGSTPLQYQWMLNGIAISGATSASYTTPVLTF